MLMIVPRKGEKLKIIASSLSGKYPGMRVNCTACISIGGAPLGQTDLSLSPLRKDHGRSPEWKT